MDTESNTSVAVKLIDSTLDAEMQKLLITEINNLGQLAEHNNVIKLMDYGFGIYEKSSGKQKNVCYIVSELAPGGELFDFISSGGAFDEGTARYYFK